MGGARGPIVLRDLITCSTLRMLRRVNVWNEAGVQYAESIPLRSSVVEHPQNRWVVADFKPSECRCQHADPCAVAAVRDGTSSSNRIRASSAPLVAIEYRRVKTSPPRIQTRSWRRSSSSTVRPSKYVRRSSSSAWKPSSQRSHAQSHRARKPPLHSANPVPRRARAC